MLDKILRIIKKIIPQNLFDLGQPIYHYSLSLLGAVIYGFPGNKLKVVGITGTKGKSSVTYIISAILETAGYKVARTSTIDFKIGEEIKENKYKMSMPGRFFMQNFLHQALKAKCDWVVLEATSEGSKQFRHKFIPFEAFIFTNLSKEHIEAHGSFEKYKQAKLNLVKNLKPNGTLIVNGDDKHSVDFLAQYKNENKDHKISFNLDDAKPYKLENGIEMRLNKTTIFSKLQGEFNIYNILAAISFAKSIGISDDIIKKGIESIEEIPGRAQRIENKEGIEVYVDYAHTPDSLTALYKTFPNKKKICILGNTGGGRDTWKRPEMAKIAEEYCEQIIFTNEDPYDEDPDQIIDQMTVAISKPNWQKIIDRRTAIREALILANQTKDSVVLITGKGTDPYIMEANGKKTPWSDAEVVREEISKL